MMDQGPEHPTSNNEHPTSNDKRPPKATTKAKQKVENRKAGKSGPKPGSCEVRGRYKPCAWEGIGRCKPGSWEVHAWYMPHQSHPRATLDRKTGSHAPRA